MDNANDSDSYNSVDLDDQSAKEQDTMVVDYLEVGVDMYNYFKREVEVKAGSKGTPQKEMQYTRAVARRKCELK
ncbi:hypothetical protein ACMD2_13591 [Ananas comosus]|uniref:Uncharacterized protein n=1 Tax=Ananas comosus TaxID=4615 RepID=A0A199V936_ANACO|nr:hypothetical protein ACMD2_13591 [Ananas comosus]